MLDTVRGRHGAANSGGVGHIGGGGGSGGGGSGSGPSSGSNDGVGSADGGVGVAVHMGSSEDNSKHNKRVTGGGGGGKAQAAAVGAIRARVASILQHPSSRRKAVLWCAVVLGWLYIASLDETGAVLHLTIVLAIAAGVIACLATTVIRATAKQPARRPVVYISILLVASVLRLALPPGLLQALLAMVCGGCLLMVAIEVLPGGTIVLMLSVAWVIINYQWLVPEFCKHTAPWNSRCYIFWFCYPLVLGPFMAVWWYRRYGKEAATHITRAIIATPMVFGLLFLCAFWCLVSVNTFWMQDEPYTKSQVLSYLPPDVSLGHRTVRHEDDLASIGPDEYPIVLKPDICTRGGAGVSPIDNANQAAAYISERDKTRPEHLSVLQTLHTSGNEAVLFYYRFPYSSRGWIKTIWVKRSHVTDRKFFPMREAMLRRAGELQSAPVHKFWQREGTQCLIRDDIAASRALLDKVNALAAGIPGGCTGARFDVKYENDEALAAGEFRVIEVDLPPFGDRREKDGMTDEVAYNGFGNSARQARTLAMQMFIGGMNIVMGYTTGPLDTIAMLPKLIERSQVCEYHDSMAPATPGLQ